MIDYETFSAGQKKINEYADRIKAGESKEEIYRDLPDVFKLSIEKELEKDKIKSQEAISEVQVPPQYEGLPSYVLEEIWTIPIYVDDEKTKAEQEKKQRVLEMLRKREETKNLEEEKITSAAERIEEIKEEMGLKEKGESEEGETQYNKFSVANGETDTGVFWYQYRNKKAKELKQSGQFEWGKERIYFDIKMEDMERLRDLVIKIVGENEIAVAFKHLDEQKTLEIQKDGKETRFVVNFATEDDAKKFLLAIKKDSSYATFVSDRNLSHNGIRIDGIAEYASGFREGRAALERIMQGSFNDDKTKYTYKAESGREITIDADQYEIFRKQYEKFSSDIATKEKEWLKLFQ